MRSEASIEGSCCAYARKRGVLPIKLQAGVTGEPDRGFVLPGHVLWLVEFKRQGGGRMRPRQKQRHRELEALGIHVTVLDDRDHFVALLDMLLEAT